MNPDLPDSPIHGDYGHVCSEQCKVFQRPYGFYWVKERNDRQEWVVAEWDEYGWLYPARDWHDSDEPFVVGPKIEPPA